MLNSGKKICASRDKKINILTLVLSEKKFLNETKNHNNFDFQNITAERVEKIINTINIKKATGADNIPTKVVRQCKVTVAQQLSSLINLSINTGVFPDSLKVAQVSPIHKKNDPLNKSNYRPVSV